MTFLTNDQLDKIAEDFKKTYAGLGEGYYERSWMYKVIEQAKKANEIIAFTTAYENGRRNGFYKSVEIVESVAESMPISRAALLMAADDIRELIKE